MKRYPCLVKKKLCKTEVHAMLDREEVDEHGDALTAAEFDALCNYQDSAKSVLTAEKKLVQLSGKALFPGDIAPEIANISSGTITVHGEERVILQGRKNRNPDGTVNYTELDVM